MTQTTSHIFYASKNSDSELIQVFITPDRITVIEKGFMKKGLRGEALSEAQLRKYQYQLRTNNKGDKYLSFEVESEGRMVDESFSMLKLFDNYNPSPNIVNLIQANEMVTLAESEPFYSLIEETIREWFGYPLDADINMLRMGILFPSLRGQETEPYAWIVALLDLQEAFPEIVTKLRENPDWTSFLRAICCKDMIATDEDLTKLMSNPWLLYLAILNLSAPLSQIDSSTSSAFIETFGNDVADMKCVKFMLDNLPKSEISAATELLFDIVSRYARLKDNLTARLKAELGDDYDDEEGVYSPIHFSSGESRFSIGTPSFSIVPKALKPVLAQSLLERIANGVESQIAEAENSADCSEVSIESELCDVFVGFLTKLAEPALRSDLTVQDVTDRMEECFGSEPLKQNGTLEFIDSSWGLIWPVTKRRSSLILSLENSVDNSVKNSRSKLIAAVCDNGAYFDKEGNLTSYDNRYYSTNDLMKLIEASVKKIDKNLAKLGREITPENRGAYLMFNHKERNQVKTWYYYDLGITELHKIIALKLAKVRDESSIINYSQLSDKSFEEAMNVLGEEIVEEAKFFAGITLGNRETLRYYFSQSGQSNFSFDDIEMDFSDFDGDEDNFCLDDVEMDFSDFEEDGNEDSSSSFGNEGEDKEWR